MKNATQNEMIEWCKTYPKNEGVFWLDLPKKKKQVLCVPMQHKNAVVEKLTGPKQRYFVFPKNQAFVETVPGLKTHHTITLRNRKNMTITEATKLSKSHLVFYTPVQLVKS